MTTFDKRERSEETKFAHDEEIAFRVRPAATSWSPTGQRKSWAVPMPTPTRWS